MLFFYLLQGETVKSTDTEALNVDGDWVNKRWPTRIFYGGRGELRHPYTRMHTPNLKLMSCYYRCKSYRTYGCDAKLKLKEKAGAPGIDEWTLVGHHTELCQNKNGIRATNYSSPGRKQEGANMKDITEIFKKRLTELAVDKIWLAPMKIWSMVRDEMVGAEEGGPLTFPTSDVVSTCFLRIIAIENEHVV